jgi:cell division protein FtsB
MIQNLFKNLPFGIIILLIIVFIYYIYEIFFGMYSFTEIKKLESKKETLFIDNNIQIKKNKNLESELESLTYDEDALEGYARQELGLIKEGEIIIEIEND